MSKKRKQLPSDLTFRAYTAEDFNGLRALNDILFPVKYDDDFYGWLLQPNFYSLLVVSPTNEIVAAATARKKKYRWGASRLSEWWNNIDSQRHAYLMTFGVAPEYRRQGLGRVLLERLLSLLKENGIKDLTLHVKRGNEAAIRFYRQYGFIPLKALRQYYLIEGKRYDAFWMLLKNVGDSTARNDFEMSLIGSAEPGNDASVWLLFALILAVIFLIFVLYQFTL